VAALAILDRLDVIDLDTLAWWLSERQLPNGGLNGRPEKLEDVSLSYMSPSGITAGSGCGTYASSVALTLASSSQLFIAGVAVVLTTFACERWLPVLGFGINGVVCSLKLICLCLDIGVL